MVIELMSPSTDSRSFVIYSWESKRGAQLNTVYIIHSLMLFKFKYNIISVENFSCRVLKIQLHSNLYVREKGEYHFWLCNKTITWQGQASRRFIQCCLAENAQTELRSPFLMIESIYCNQAKWLELSSFFIFFFVCVFLLWSHSEKPFYPGTV